MRRVVVTGIGAVTPLGNSFHNSWSLVKRGVSGIDVITKCDAFDLSWKMAGEVKGFDPEVYMSKTEVMRLDPFVQYAVGASAMAVHDAGLMARDSGVGPPGSDLTSEGRMLPHSKDATRHTADNVTSGGVVIGS